MYCCQSDYWADHDNATPVSYRKIMTERLAWLYVQEMLYDKRFELVSVNPGIVFGDSLTNNMFESGYLVKQILQAKSMGYPRTQIPCVDVRDVASALREATVEEAAASKRFLVIENKYWLEEIGDMLEQIYEQKGYTIETKQTQIAKMPKFAAWVASFYDNEADQIYKNWDHELIFDDQETLDILRLSYKDFYKTLSRTVSCLIKMGHTPDQTQKGSISWPKFC